MTAEIHCSACDAIVQPGNQFCPGCGLRLMATAERAVYVERPRFSFWSILVMGIGGFVILAYLFSSVSRNNATAARQAFAADIASGKLNTMTAFESRCGSPRWIKETTQGEELHYLSSAGDDYYVTLLGDGPRIELEHQSMIDGKSSTSRTRVEPSQFFGNASCK